MNDTDFIKTDILVIGSGLAGLRSGISALEEAPNASVLIATKGSGPVGSSFTNINNALGMQVCLTDKEKEMFVHKATSIASPGTIDPALAEIMAEESKECFDFLKNQNFYFNRSESGDLIRYTGCFYPEIKGAFVFKNLCHAFKQLKKKYLSLSGQYIENQSAVHLLQRIGNDERAIRGAVFVSEATGKHTIINARTTILASGGTTPLFRWNVGGHSLSGYTPALLKNAGVEIINPEYHQFIWHHPETFQPVFPTELLKNGATIKNSEKQKKKIPDKILALIPNRETHVPAAYNFDDTEIENYLLSHADPTGIVTFVLEGKQEVPVVLCAHAWNGGARIDQSGWTGIPALFACGECAGGMHGANRIGGAMVLASQVFGRRAGISASKVYKQFPLFNENECKGETSPFTSITSDTRNINCSNTLKQNVYNSAINTLCGKRSYDLDLSKNVSFFSVNSKDIINKLLFESALIISSGLNNDF